MNIKDGKMLLTGILNNDMETVKRIVSSHFESIMERELGTASKVIMESIGDVEKQGDK